jgi:parvulin-like peptidyl-prolyl isomerase
MKLFPLILLPLVVCAQTKPAVPKKAPVKPAAAPVKPAAASAASPSDPVVLRVGEEVMTQSQWEKFLEALPEQLRAQASGPNRRKVAEQLAEMKVLSQEAKKRGLDQSPQVLQQLALQRDNMLASALYQDLVKSVKPDAAAMQAYYDQHKNEYQQVRARHILIRMQGSRVPLKPNQKDLTEAEALAKTQDLRKRIEGGEDFAAIAKTESDDTGSGAAGGDLGAFSRGQMVGPFEEAAFSLPKGQLSEPVKTPFGYHLIQVEEQVEKKFEEVKLEIEQKIKPDMAKQAIEAIKKQTPLTIDEGYFGK